MRKSSLIILLVSLFAQMSWATISNVQIVGGYSALDLTSSTVPIIYGGMAGGAAGGCASPDGAHTCNSCDPSLFTNFCGGSSATGASCNASSVYDSLPITITFQSDNTGLLNGTTASSGSTTPAVIYATYGSTTGPSITPMGATTQGNPLPANSTLTMQFTWSTLCSLAGGSFTGGNCEVAGAEGDFSTSIFVGLASGGTLQESQQITVNFRNINGVTAGSGPNGFTDITGVTPGEGTYGFTVFPGDSKAYINNIGVNAQATAGSSQVDYKAVRVFYASFDPSIGVAPTTYCQGTNLLVNPATAMAAGNFTDLTISNPSAGDSNLSSNKVEGLTNGQLYLFSIANVDQAGNISYFQNPNPDPTVSLLLVNQNDISSTTKTTATVPEPVYGVLDGKGCFIATAAYGSDMAPQVDLLRKFRNQFLLPHEWGKSFVRTYYKYSPPIANYIAQREWLRTIVRLCLWPLIFMANLSLKFGFAAVASGFIFMVSLATLLWLLSPRFKLRKSDEA